MNAVCTIPGLPAGLYEAAMVIERSRHGARMTGLDAIKPQLQLLDAFTPALLSRGIDLRLLDITQAWDHTVLGIPAAQLANGGCDLFDALLALGFVAEQRDVHPHTPFTAVRLRHGALCLSMWLLTDGPRADISARAAAYRRSAP